MRNIVALIATMAVLGSSSMAFAGCPSGSANPSNVSWSQQQAGSSVGGIWGGLLSSNPNQDGQIVLDALWLAAFGNLNGVPSCSGRKCGEICQDQLFIELLLVIIIELHHCPTQSCNC